MRELFEHLVPPTLRQAPPWVHVLINQTAWPGLGSLLRGRREGLAQTLIALAGFACLIIFFVGSMGHALRALFTGIGDNEAQSMTAIYRPFAHWGQVGAGLFALAWIWALLSSFLMLRQKTPPPLPRTR